MAKPGYWEHICDRAVHEMRKAIPGTARVLDTRIDRMNHPHKITFLLRIQMTWVDQAGSNPNYNPMYAIKPYQGPNFYGGISGV